MTEPSGQPAKPPRTWRPMAAWTAAIVLLFGVLTLVSWLYRSIRATDRIIAAACCDYGFSVPEESRRRLIETLGGPGRAASRLTFCLEAPSWMAPHKCEAVYFLGECGEPGMGAVIRALDHKEAYVRQRAAVAVGNFGPKARATIPTLRLALKDPDEMMRCYAVRALGQMGAGEAVDDLIVALADKCEAVRYNAATALGAIGPAAERAAPALEIVLRDQKMNARAPAAEALGLIGPQARRAVPALVEAFGDEDYDVRRNAAAALAKADLAAQPALVSALRHENRRVREWAAFTLVEFPDRSREVLPVLIEALGDEGVAEHGRAAELLQRFGPEARAAIPALETLTESRNPWVRSAAAEALKKIRGEEKPK